MDIEYFHHLVLEIPLHQHELDDHLQPHLLGQRLLVGRLLRGGSGRERDEHGQEQGRAPHAYSFLPTTKAGAPAFTSTAWSERAPPGQRNETLWRPAASARSRIGG